MLMICGSIASCSYLVISRLNVIYPFYVCAMAVGFSAAGMSLLPATEVVSNWFVKRGAFIGLTMAFTGVGNVILAPVISYLIYKYGWHTGFIGMAASSAMVTFIPALWLKTTPDEVGLKPWGYVESDSPQDGPGQVIDGVSAQEAIGSRSFKILVAAIFLVNACLVSVAAMLPTQHADLGYDPIRITFLVSFYSAVLVFVKVGLGVLNDVFGTLKAFAFACLCGCVGIGLVGYGSSYAVMLPALVCVAIGSSTNNVFPPLFTTMLYGNKDYPPIFSRIQSASMLGYACGFPLYGAVYDTTGNYRPAYLVGVVVTMICLCVLPQVKKKSWQGM
jgi:MFS family permease